MTYFVSCKVTGMYIKAEIYEEIVKNKKNVDQNGELWLR